MEIYGVRHGEGIQVTAMRGQRNGMIWPTPAWGQETVKMLPQGGRRTTKAEKYAIGRRNVL